MRSCNKKGAERKMGRPAGCWLLVVVVCLCLCSMCMAPHPPQAPPPPPPPPGSPPGRGPGAPGSTGSDKQRPVRVSKASQPPSTITAAASVASSSAHLGRTGGEGLASGKPSKGRLEAFCGPFDAVAGFPGASPGQLQVRVVGSFGHRLRALVMDVQFAVPWAPPAPPVCTSGFVSTVPLMGIARASSLRAVRLVWGSLIVVAVVRVPRVCCFAVSLATVGFA